MALLLHQSDLANGSDIDVSVTVPAGDRRRCFVGYQVEAASGAALAATLDAVAMTPVPGAGGTVEAAANSQHIQWFQLLDADLPASGVVTLNVTSSASPAGASVHVVIVDDAPQELAVASASTNVATGGTTTKTTTLSPTDGGGYVFCLSGSGNAVNLTHTFGGDAPTSELEEDAAGTTTGTTAVWVAQGDTGSTTLSVVQTGTFNRLGMTGFAIDLDEGVTTVTVTGAMQLQAATVSGSLRKRRTVTGAMALQAATGSGSLRKRRTVSASMQLQAATGGGSLRKLRTVSGAMQLQAATGGGSLRKLRTVTGAMQLQAATVSGSLTVQGAANVVTGAMQLQAATIVNNRAVLYRRRRIRELDSHSAFLPDAGSFTHTIQAGTGRHLLLWVFIPGDDATGVSVTVGGVSAQLVNSAASSSDDGSFGALLEVTDGNMPSAGAQSVAVSFSAAAPLAFVCIQQFSNVLERGATSLGAALTFGSGTTNVGFAVTSDMPPGSIMTIGAVVHTALRPQYTPAARFGSGEVLLGGMKQEADAGGYAYRVGSTDQSDTHQFHIARFDYAGPTFGGAVGLVGARAVLHAIPDTSVNGTMPLQAATASGLLRKRRTVQAAMVLQAATVTGSLRKVNRIFGAMQLQAATVAGFLQKTFAGTLLLVVEVRRGSGLRVQFRDGNGMKVEHRSGSCLRVEVRQR